MPNNFFSQIILMWAVKRKKCVKNLVNDAKFINFNTIFLKKYHSSHHFSFKSCLKNFLGDKITNFHQTMFANFQNGSSKIWSVIKILFSFWLFTFSNNYPKIFLHFLAVLRDVNNFMKKSLGMMLLSGEV